MAVAKISFKDIPDEPVGETMSRKVAGGQNMSLARYVARAGTLAATHSHPHEQLSMVLEGRFRFVIDGQSTELGPGEFMFIPPGKEHGGEVLEDAVILDLFSPAREDMAAGSDPLKRLSR